MPSLQSFLQLRSSTVTSPSGSQGPSPRSLVAQSLHSGPMSFTQDPSSSPSGVHHFHHSSMWHILAQAKMSYIRDILSLILFYLSPFSPAPRRCTPWVRALRQSRQRQSGNLRVRALRKPRQGRSGNLRVRAPSCTGGSGCQGTSSSSSSATTAAAI